MRRDSIYRLSPSWLLRQPVLLSSWVAWRNTTARIASRRGWALPIAGIAASAAVIVLLNAFEKRISALTDLAVAYSGLMAGLVALHSATLVTRNRHRLEAMHLSSWLATAPIAAANVRQSVAIRTFLLAVSHLSLLVFVLLLVAGSSSPLSVALRLSTYAAAGFAAGALVGWYWPVRRKRSSTEGSRYVPGPRVRSTPGSRPVASALPLSRWPIAQTFAWNRPENARVILVIALLSVQGGSSIATGVCVVGAWVLAAYLTSLLRATVHVARDAANWLRATPMTFFAFAWSVARRALLHQCIGAVVGTGVLIALGASPLMAVYLAILWVTLVLVVCTISLVACYQGRSPRLKIALSVAAMGTAEARESGWSIPVAVLMIVWQLRRGARA